MQTEEKQEFLKNHFECWLDKDLKHFLKPLSLKGFRLVLGGIPVHTEYRCLFFLRCTFLKYRNTGVI